jgi:hypothetical protein
MRDLALVFVEVRCSETWSGRSPAARRRSEPVTLSIPGLKAALIGNLEHVVGCSEDRRDAAVLIQNILQEREAVILLGAVVQRIAAAVRRFDAQRVRS